MGLEELRKTYPLPKKNLADVNFTNRELTLPGKLLNRLKNRKIYLEVGWNPFGVACHIINKYSGLVRIIICDKEHEQAASVFGNMECNTILLPVHPLHGMAILSQFDIIPDIVFINTPDQEEILLAQLRLALALFPAAWIGGNIAEKKSLKIISDVAAMDDLYYRTWDKCWYYDAYERD